MLRNRRSAPATTILRIMGVTLPLPLNAAELWTRWCRHTDGENVSLLVVVYSAFSAVISDVDWSENSVSALEQSDATLRGDWQSDSVVSWLGPDRLFPTSPSLCLLSSAPSRHRLRRALHCTSPLLSCIQKTALSLSAAFCIGWSDVTVICGRNRIATSWGNRAYTVWS